MKLRTIVYDNLVEQLHAGQDASLLNSKYLGITLRARIYLPDDKEICNDPVRRATSKLLAEQGGNVFWLLTGGVIESNLELAPLRAGQRSVRKRATAVLIAAAIRKAIPWKRHLLP